METLANQILKLAAGLSEGAPLVAKELLHLSGRATVNRALSRLARQGALVRVSHGIYALPVVNRFGTGAPSVAKMVEGLARLSGETIVSHGATAANALGMTTQVPIREVYLTSGRNRRLKLGAQTVELRHAPSWQLMFPERAAGAVIRALSWMGPEHAGEAIQKLRAKLPAFEWKEIASVRACLPTWMAQKVNTLVSPG